MRHICSFPVSFIVFILIPAVTFGPAPAVHAETAPLIINTGNRNAISLNGTWNIIIDPYETGFYDYRYEESSDGYFKNAKPQNKSQRIEYSFDSNNKLFVPGDWNHQRNDLFWYEGTIWYKKDFSYTPAPEKRLFVYFGAVNYKAHVYVNGSKAGSHEGGFTPFNIEITDSVHPGDNFIVVKADNSREREYVPTLNTDWWNYGGITRRAMLIETPETFIRDYVVQLEKGTKNTIAGWVQLDGAQVSQNITVAIPEINTKTTVTTDTSGYARFRFNADIKRWSPEQPVLYDVLIETDTDSLNDRIGFRTIETRGHDILLNGKPIFLRGICIHEEAPHIGRRACTRDDAHTLLTWAKELNCNFVRLAHYPHNEYMTRLADEMGIMVWSEIPVYWTILWESQETFENAKRQLTEMITRDRNKASVILWSVANETPISPERNDFLRRLVDTARKLDSSRLVTAALERHYTDETTQMIDDPLGEYLDVIGCNEYIGWYDGMPEKCDTITFETIYTKPVIFSELGGGALYGYHADTGTVWSEEFQENLYQHQVDMIRRVPFIRGTAPWILKDFRSPRRPLPGIQDYWNRKGLISNRGEKKKAFYVLQKFYYTYMKRK